MSTETTTPEQIAAEYYDRFDKHRLILVSAGPITAFYLKDPEQGRMMSTLIVFTPEGIALMGDLVPERQATASPLGYGIDWFAGHKSSGYLAEKFLTRKWSRKAAIDWLKWYAENHDEADRPKIASVIQDFDDDFGPERFVELLDDNDLHSLCDDGVPGHTYSPLELGLLCAIQRKFSALYAQRIAVEEIGLYVRVDHPRFHSIGVVHDVQDFKLGVLLENGNVWDYERETIRPATAEEVATASSELKRRRNQMLARNAAIQAQKAATSAA